MVKWVHFRGKNHGCHFHILSLLNAGQLTKERSCLPSRRFFLREYSFVEGCSVQLIFERSICNIRFSVLSQYKNEDV